MKKEAVIVLTLVILLFVTSCTVVTCNKPYIKMGTSCCLDQNDNLICDSDEVEKKETPVAPVEAVEEEVSTYTISDLQADIGNVYWNVPSEFVILVKDAEAKGVVFYAFQPKKTVRLGKGIKDIYKVLPYRYVVVSVANEELKTSDSFFNFIKKHGDYLTEPLRRNKEELIKDFTNGEEYKRIQELYHVGDYISHTSDEIVIADDFGLIETVTEKIVIRDFVSLEGYKVNYSFYNGKKERQITGVNYLKSTSIFCTPTITITIYDESIPPGASIGTETDLKNFYKNRNKIYSDAQALVSMCEKRYQFSYLRNR